MLQLQRANAGRSSPYVPACRSLGVNVACRPCVSGMWRSSESKRVFRNTVRAQAVGDQVAAFVQVAEAPTTEAPSVVSRQLMVYTTEGGKSFIDVLPGITTVGQVRAAVAEKTGTAPDQVRLAYAGKELDPANDATPLALKPGIDVIAAIHRFQGGGTDNSSTPAAVNTTAPEALTPSRRRAGARHRVAPVEQNGLGAADSSRSSRYYRIAVQRARAGASWNETQYLLSFISNAEADDVYKVWHTVQLQRQQVQRERQREQQRRQQEGSLPAAGESAAVWAATTPAASQSGRRRSDLRTVPGGKQGASAEVQLARQFRDLMKNPIPGVSAAPSDDNLFLWHVQLAGPEGTPYAGGWFNVELVFTDRFPGEQPIAHFVTKIWHPNVSYATGKVCVALGTWGRSGVGYSNVCSVVCVLTGLQMLLSTLSPDHAYNQEAAQQLMGDVEGFNRQAREYTRQYAM